jgi:cytochrome c-type biogenesis protein CcmE
VASPHNPARLVVALAVAGALAIFLLYTSIAGGGTPAIKPSQLRTHAGTVQLVGKVVGRPTGDAHGGGLHFRLRDIGGTATVPVVYAGSPGDYFGVGKDILVTGRLRDGVFVAQRDSMITKCPSRYIPKKSSS